MQRRRPRSHRREMETFSDSAASVTQIPVARQDPPSFPFLFPPRRRLRLCRRLLRLISSAHADVNSGRMKNLPSLVDRVNFK